MNDKELALLIFKAIHALGIDVPIMGIVLLPGDRRSGVPDRVQLALYGGRVVVFPEDDGRMTANNGSGDTAVTPSPASSAVAVARVQPSAESPHACPAEVDSFFPPEKDAVEYNDVFDPGPVGQPAPRSLPAQSIAEVNHPAVRDLEGLELVTLQDLARRQGIKVTRKMNRDALIIALRGVK